MPIQEFRANSLYARPVLTVGLCVVAVAAAVIAVASDTPAVGLVAAGVAVLLAVGVLRLSAANSDLASRVATAEKEADRLELAVADKVTTDITQGRTAPEVLHDLDVSDTSDLADEETGLLGERYFVVTLEARVAAARRHLKPLALVLLDAAADPEDPTELLDPVMCADVVRETLRDADTLCRLKSGRFAMLLEDTPENGAIWTVERIRRRISEQAKKSTVWAGIACYPANGFDGPEVLARAHAALDSAREWHQDRTEVAET